MAFATTAAARLIGSYPNAKANDPETFTAQVVRLFLKYEREIVAYVVESLPGKRSKDWDGLPSLAAITEALDSRAGSVSRQFERERRIAAQLAARGDGPGAAERERVGRGFDALRSRLAEQLGADRARRAAQGQSIDRANARVFAAECAAAGMPGSDISPSLRKLLAQRGSPA